MFSTVDISLVTTFKINFSKSMTLTEIAHPKFNYDCQSSDV